MNMVLTVWGDYACFTRPVGGKVERFSYPVITPSAARAVFDAIYWKPTFRWRVSKIEVLTLPRYLSLMRNEVKDWANMAALEKALLNKKLPVPPLFADATEDETGSDKKGRTQRQTMALCDVKYRLHAEPQLFREDNGERQKIVAQFTRRAIAGQCRWQPYFGCREFAAYFELGEGEAEPPAAYSETIGMMLYDVWDLARPLLADGTAALPFVSMFPAEIKNGVLEVPPFDSEHVRRPGAFFGQEEVIHD